MKKRELVEEPQYEPHAAPSAMWPCGWGVKADPTAPRDEVQLRAGGRIVARIAGFVA